MPSFRHQGAATQRTWDGGQLDDLAHFDDKVVEYYAFGAGARLDGRQVEVGRHYARRAVGGDLVQNGALAAPGGAPGISPKRREGQLVELLTYPESSGLTVTRLLCFRYLEMKRRNDAGRRSVPRLRHKDTLQIFANLDTQRHDQEPHNQSNSCMRSENTVKQYNTSYDILRPIRSKTPAFNQASSYIQGEGLAIARPLGPWARQAVGCIESKLGRLVAFKANIVDDLVAPHDARARRTRAADMVISG
jgi:hypothetical protein